MEDKTYSGTGAKTMVQCMVRLQRDFTERLLYCITKEYLDEHEKHSKITTVLLNIMKAAKHNGVESRELHAAAEDASRFLMLDPKV